jgi:hypothetical protein
VVAAQAPPQSTPRKQLLGTGQSLATCRSRVKQLGLGFRHGVQQRGAASRPGACGGSSGIPRSPRQSRQLFWRRQVSIALLVPSVVIRPMHKPTRSATEAGPSSAAPDFFLTRRSGTLSTRRYHCRNGALPATSNAMPAPSSTTAAAVAPAEDTSLVSAGRLLYLNNRLPGGWGLGCSLDC